MTDSIMESLRRVPDTVFLFLGISRERASQMGVIGCGLQLNDDYEYSWSETTVTLSPNKEEVRIFLTVRRIPFSHVPNEQRPLRISMLDMEDFILRYENIQRFLCMYRRNRFLRLGHRAYVPSWELDSREAFLLGMSDDDFDRHYVADPRGQLTFGEIARRESRHSPVELVRPAGIPDPGQGYWI